MTNHISLSNFVLNRVRCLVSFQILLRGLISDLWLSVPRGFGLRCGPAQPGPAQLGPRAPLVPFSHLISPTQQPLSPTSLSLPVVP
jgi:hypothetical protein